MTITCAACGFDFERASNKGRRPKMCPDCRPRRASVSVVRPAHRTLGGYDMARQDVDYRLALEQIAALLRIGRTSVALLIIEQVLTRKDISDADQRPAAG